jgi:general stress protein 26
LAPTSIVAISGMGTIKPTTPPSDAEHQTRVREILDDAGTVMLATRLGSDELHCRPMAVARVDDDGTMYFATGMSSPKIDELRTDARVQIIFQSKTRYATVSGTARIRRERALIDELWNDSWKIWFPDGKDDPDIAIVEVVPTRGEYWDQSGTRGLSFLYRAAKAYVTRSELEPRPEDHGKVKM